jgi:peptide deformylase
MARLQIITEPDPRFGRISSRLRQKAARIERIDEGVVQLAHDMFDAMIEGNGVGLAAPQVGIGRRLVVVHFPEGYDDEDDPEINLMLINPEIQRAGGREVGPEGCLSFPDLVGDVPRYATVTVRATDLEGKTLRIKARGLLARCLQHEIDHLDGVLFFDRMDDWSSLRYPAEAPVQSEVSPTPAEQAATAR